MMLWILRAAAIVAANFGALTIRSGGAVLFGAPETAQVAGDAVPLVVWFNFIAGFPYVAAAIGLWKARRWGAWTAFAIAGATALAFALFGLHVAAGGAFEMRTVLWSGIAALACFSFGCVARSGGHSQRTPS